MDGSTIVLLQSQSSVRHKSQFNSSLKTTFVLPFLNTCSFSSWKKDLYFGVQITKRFVSLVNMN